MSDAGERRGLRSRRAIGAAAVAAVLLVGYLVVRPEPAALEPRPRSEAPRERRREPVEVVPEPSAGQNIELASDGLPIMPHRPTDAGVDGPMHPHPHTPAHDRIYRENNLIGALNGAMDVRDVQGMRRLLAEYQDEYPDDPHALQEGYEIIADCLEHPGEAARSVAQQYHRERKSSTLRRYVRRHCLE